MTFNYTQGNCRQTDTHDNGIYHDSVVSRGKNRKQHRCKQKLRRKILLKILKMKHADSFKNVNQNSNYAYHSSTVAASRASKIPRTSRLQAIHTARPTDRHNSLVVVPVVVVVAGVVGRRRLFRHGAVPHRRHHRGGGGGASTMMMMMMAGADQHLRPPSAAAAPRRSVAVGYLLPRLYDLPTTHDNNIPHHLDVRPSPCVIIPCRRSIV